ncbi:MAG: DciA family protein [Alphaproteobacteria bacterium]|nr:DciA family protein [Alphaproteobacteria bacterium]
MSVPSQSRPGWRQTSDEQAALARLSEVRARPAARAAPSLGVAMHRALAPLLKEAGPAPDTLRARWPEIVGARLAAITEPVKVAMSRRGGTLTIRAPSAAAPMIQHAAESILQKVNLASGSKIVALRIVQSTARQAVPVALPALRPLGPDERAALASAIAPIGNAALREALGGLGEAVLASTPRIR